MAQIIDAYLGLTALRQAGYRSTATAIAELVDNSLEAGAENIAIIAMSEGVFLSQRKSSQIQRIAVLDNGRGMPVDVLENCLSLGWGTRLETRDGLGRFGFGLKGASISQARCVEVYSWIAKGEVFRAYLDLHEIHAREMQELPPIERADLPVEISTFFGAEIGETGTLVVWSELDQMDLKRPTTLLGRLNKELCRIYRHFLDDCDEYGGKRNIVLHMLDCDEKRIIKNVQLKANDPLYLLTPNNLPGYEHSATNVLHGDPFSIDVPYHRGAHREVAKVQFRCSIAKPEIQELGGGSVVGKHYAQNSGISFVRAGREIDFGSFGFTDQSEPRHRWWGIEVRFDPILDEYFGVTNNKQEVRAIKKLDQDVKESFMDPDNDEDYRGRMLVEIDKILTDQIAEMMKIIKGRREGVLKERRKSSALTYRVNQDVLKDTSPTESQDHGCKLSDERKVEERANLLLENDASLTNKEAVELAQETINFKVDIQTGDWPGELFLDRRPVANASVGIINRRTKFYEGFWYLLEKQADRKGFEALEVLIMALVRSEDELVKEYDRKIFERFRQRWGSWVEKLIDHAGS